jgi:hypothetical protein
MDEDSITILSLLDADMHSVDVTGREENGETLWRETLELDQVIVCFRFGVFVSA